MTDRIRYGIIGAGMMGREHLRNIAAIPGAVATAVADPDARSREAARAHLPPGAAVYADYRRLLASPEVDAVVVATPNHTHIEVMREVFRTGKHVLVEKPLATTIDDCREIVASAERHPGVVGVGLEYRYMAPVARLVAEVRAGSVGRLRMLAIREHRWPFLVKVGDWNRFNRDTGGTLVEKCCHFFDLMCLVTGSRPLRVFASGGQDVNHLDEAYGGERPDILDNAYVIVDFEDGTRALLDLCMFADGSLHEQEIAATGDRGKVECFLPQSTLAIASRDRPRTAELITLPLDPRVAETGFHHGASYLEHLAFIAAIRGEAPVEVTPRDGLVSVAMGLAAQQSIAEGRVVELAEYGV